jgi:OST3 / OST6 family, transporter family
MKAGSRHSSKTLCSCVLIGALSAGSEHGWHAGGLYNIIRNVPMSTTGQDGHFRWYLPGQGQLGLEGLTVGAMYVGFALCCTGLISLPKYIRDKSLCRMACYTCLIAACLLFVKVVHFYKWKTGYHWRFYLLDWMLGIHM